MVFLTLITSARSRRARSSGSSRRCVSRRRGQVSTWSSSRRRARRGRSGLNLRDRRGDPPPLLLPRKNVSIFYDAGKVAVLEDAVAGVNAADSARALVDMRQRGAFLLASDGHDRAG